MQNTDWESDKQNKTMLTECLRKECLRNENKKPKLNKYN